MATFFLIPNSKAAAWFCRYICAESTLRSEYVAVR
jgi:hypothetical protein